MRLLVKHMWKGWNKGCSIRDRGCEQFCSGAKVCWRVLENTYSRSWTGAASNVCWKLIIGVQDATRKEEVENR
jgi:hypothetical protein